MNHFLFILLQVVQVNVKELQSWNRNLSINGKFKFSAKSIFILWIKKKRIFPWFYQHCVSTMLVELSVDLSKSFLISRKGTFVIFKSERERVEVRPQLRYEGRQNWLSADGEFWDVCFPSVCLHFSITWRYLWLTASLNMREEYLVCPSVSW